MRSRVIVLRVALFWVALFAAVVICDAKRWSPEELESPKETGSSPCNSRFGSLSSVCDPSGLISEEQRRTIDRAIAALETKRGGFGAKCASYNVGAAVVRYMSTDGYSSASQTAEWMGKVLFSEWAMGDCGVLLFVSTGDRRIYIAVGTSAREVLTSSRLRSTIEHMRQYFSYGDTGRGLLVGVQDIGQFLFPGSADARSTGEHAESEFGFWGWELTCVTIVAVLALVVACLNGTGGPEKMRLKTMSDSNRCVLCLEKMEPHGTAISAGSGAPAPTLVDASETPGETITLPCGHVFHRTVTCWLGWSSSNENESCPLCQVAEGSTSLVESDRATRVFRLRRIATLHPELEERVAEAIRVENGLSARARRDAEASHSRQVDTSYPHYDHQSGLGWMLGAGAAGAAIGSMFGRGWGNADHGERADSAPSFWGMNQDVSGQGGGWGAPSISLGGAGGGWTSHIGGGDGSGWGGGTSGEGGGW
jgi:uncharacterized membrane protein YgcG